jgi:hypothetical protein
MSGAIHPLPQYAFMAWCLVKHRDNFTFTFTHFESLYSVLPTACEHQPVLIIMSLLFNFALE